ncbi:MBL fold metallo-hydrolase [Protofrankia coriariae]|uniref:Beta-lactamase n=1 Tax=Protofrankia coriariae TaxID=1562887 RepID=A0ABR5F7K7_9ACTN|nr:MBL fold metallo-hydrolase [Protofrankia coriariae]KLL12707.1 beta-lactamase [Protofrankia coriariae]
MPPPPNEQPDDWTEPGAHPVAAGVYRIPLPLPYSGLRAVNVYVVPDVDGLVVVDSGWAMPSTESALATALSTLGYQLDNVSRVVVTHAHHDHYTQALALRARFGTKVSIGWGERHSILAGEKSEVLTRPQIAMLLRCGAPELAERYARYLVHETDHSQNAPWGPPDSWLDDGDVVGLAERKLDVLATPGHTRGHVVLRDNTNGLLFAGDHVLPHITPSLGFEWAPEPSPLRSFLQSLRLMGGLPDTLLLPAHGPVTTSVHRRVEELLAHHEARLDTAARNVRAGAETAFQVAAAMRWTRRERRLDELDTTSQTLAVLEIEAHLDLLVEHDQLVAATTGDGVVRYATRN